MTNTCKIVQGRISSPCFIFLRASGRLTDEDLLTLLGLEDFPAAEPEIDRFHPHLFITEDQDWIHVADDVCYNLWSKGGHELVQKLHEKIPDISIFACSVGEADWSFDFAYYQFGNLRRRYIVEDRGYSLKTRRVVENFGLPLSGETPLSALEGDEQVYVLKLASELGVNLNHDLSRVRCYAKSNWKRKDLGVPTDNSAGGFAFSIRRAWRKFMGH